MPTVPRVPALIACGGLGSALVAVGGMAVGAVPRGGDPVGHALHLSQLPSAAGLALALAGVAVLVAAWWALGRHLAEVGNGSVLLAAASWCAPLLLCPPLFSRDVFAYAGQAAVLGAGLDPYDHGPSAAPGPLSVDVDRVWVDRPSPYGPVFVWLSGRVVAAAGRDVSLAVLGFRLLAATGLVLLAVGLPRLAAVAGVPPTRALWLGVANPLLVLHGVGGAHNDLLMLGLLVAGLACAARGAPPQLAAAAALITLAALVKAPAAAALPFLVLLGPSGVRARARAVVVVVTTAGLTALATIAVTGLGWGWLRTLGDGDGPLSLLSPTTGVGVLVGSARTGHVLGLVVAVAVCGALLWRSRTAGAVPSLGLALLAGALLAPVVQPWYLLWGGVVLAATSSSRAAGGLAACCAVLCLVVLPSGRHVLRPPLYGVATLLAVAAGAAVARRPALSPLRPAGLPDPVPRTAGPPLR